MNKKKIMLTFLALCQMPIAFAGGILTNTNQSARFARLMALEASTKTDAAYYNPAGTIKLSEGFHFTFSNQSAFQKRIITSSFSHFDGGEKKYEGTASAPIIPSIQAVYRKGNWALSGSIAIVGGGGKATFDNGLPSFESQVSMLPALMNGYSAALGIPSGAFNAKGYSVNQFMNGTNYIFGGQLGGAYKINDKFSVYGGFRLNVVHNKYQGHLKDLTLNVHLVGIGGMLGLSPNYDGNINPTPIFDLVNASPAIPQPIKDRLALPAKMAGEGAYLDSKQSGWGVAPIIGVHFSHAGLNIGAKYEFKTALDVENKTTRDDTGRFANGVNTAHDVPALFAIGASYDILPQLTANVGYHRFFDKDASMANDKQKYLTGGTNEYLAGVEYRINKMFLVSAGGQITKYGLGDDFQSDLSFSVNSYSLGFGGAVNVSEKVQINAGYFFTDYSNYTKKSDNYNGTGVAGQDVFTRTNKVFTVGVDFSF